MSGGGLQRTANGFDHVIARATSGYDVARLEDSPGRDEFRGRAHKSTSGVLTTALIDVRAR